MIAKARCPIRSAARCLLVCGGASLAAQPPPAVAQGTPVEPGPPPWERTLVVRSGFGRLDAGNSASQSATLYLTRPEHGWILSFGHRTLLGEEGYGGGVSYARTLRDGLRAGAGFSTGTNLDGGLYPKYQAGAWLRQRLFPRFRLQMGYTRRQAREEARHSDRFGSSFIWYAPGPLIVEGNGSYTVGHPGSTRSWGGGGALTYERWRDLYVGVSVRYGDGSYVHLSTQQLLEFAGWSYRGRVTKYVRPDLTVSLSGGHSYYYGGGSITLSVGRTW